MKDEYCSSCCKAEYFPCEDGYRCEKCLKLTFVEEGAANAIYHLYASEYNEFLRYKEEQVTIKLQLDVDSYTAYLVEQPFISAGGNTPWKALRELADAWQLADADEERELE